MCVEAAVVVVFLLAIGFPLSWDKFFVALAGPWTGRYVSCTLRVLRPEDDKRHVLTGFLEAIIDGELLALANRGGGVAQLRWVAQDVPDLVVFLLILKLLEIKKLIVIKKWLKYSNK